MIPELQKIVQHAQAMARKRVMVGVPSNEAARTDAANNAMLALIHDRGSPARNIPARPFLQPGVEAALPKVEALLKRHAANALDGAAIDAGLEAAGLAAQASVKNYIRAGEHFAPLSPRTIEARKRRGFQGEKPLIETGQLINSITYVIRER